MSSTDLAAQKAELRARAQRIARGDRGAAAAEVLRRLGALPELESARVIAFYAAIGDEVPLDVAAAQARARGARVVYPVQRAAGLELAEPDGVEPWRDGPRGIREPAARSAPVRTEEVDAFLVPGLLFDRACRRLGRGGGHYDRLLARARRGAVAIGICYADRVVDELPEEPWDVAMDGVVTDRFVLRRPARGDGA